MICLLKSLVARRGRVRDARLERVRVLLADAKNTWDALFDAADRAIADDEAPSSS